MSYSDVFIEEALPLLSFDNNRKVVVNEQAVQILKRIPKPVCVIGIAGTY